MVPIGKFLKDQLMPEDPMDWIILVLVFGFLAAGIILVVIMAANGLL